jgi:cytochrome c oxidase subunit IV
MESTSHAPAAAQARHISPRTYVIVFGWLAVLTVLEVLTAAVGLDESVRVPVLIVIAIIKALLVVLFYMHLRYDSKWYWLTLIVPLGFILLLARVLIEPH